MSGLKDVNFAFDVLIIDDCSYDDISVEIKKFINTQKHSFNINLVKTKRNNGYAISVKIAFSIFINLTQCNNIIVLHGDGQYDPKYIPNLLKCLIKDDRIAAATGSRTLNGFKSAKKGGMPFYKLIGNIILTQIFNYLTSQNFTDAHTGLWAYNLSYLKNKKFNYLTNSFNFDQEFRFRNIVKKKFIKEIPIKTKYGDERSQLHIKYAIKFFFNSLFFYFIKNKLIQLKKFD